jgi:hypothetical protein
MDTIIITHNAGFFSCCSVKLHYIVEYINKYKKIPKHIDSSQQFNLYKTNNKNVDITYDYFEHYDNINICLDELCTLNNKIIYTHDHQFINYSRIDYKNIVPLVTKYFSPSEQIREIINNMETKYQLDYKNICVLFYRGNDKITETLLPSYHDYVNKANIIITKNPNIKFLIQSDETEFIEFMQNNYPNNVIFKDEIRHMKNECSSVDIKMRDNIFLYSKYYLAITIIMSKCEYIICGSGNCSIWIMLYRNNDRNVYQWCRGKYIR